MMMPQDVCDFLKIDYKTFEKTLSKVAPKCTFWQGGKVYTLEQMVNVAEIATRPQGRYFRDVYHLFQRVDPSAAVEENTTPDQMTQRRQPHRIRCGCRLSYAGRNYKLHLRFRYSPTISRMPERAIRASRSFVVGYFAKNARHCSDNSPAKICSATSGSSICRPFACE